METVAAVIYDLLLLLSFSYDQRSAKPRRAVPNDKVIAFATVAKRKRAQDDRRNDFRANSTVNMFTVRPGANIC